MLKERPARREKGRICNAGLNERSLLKNLHITATMINGKKVETATCGTADQKERDIAKECVDISGPRQFRDVMTGVPIAPNETAAESQIRATAAAPSGGQPRLTRRGAASAAGVPKPAAASRNETNRKPTIIV